MATREVGGPHADGAVARGGDDLAIVGTEGGVQDRGLVAVEGDDVAVAVAAPDLRGAVVGAGDHAPGLKAAKYSEPSWPRRTFSGLPSAFQTRAVRSREAVTMRWPETANSAE
jgi:hypothetical protein